MNLNGIVHLSNVFNYVISGGIVDNIDVGHDTNLPVNARVYF